MADTDTSEDELLDEDGDDTEASNTPTKSGRRKLVLFAAIGLLVIGGAGGGWFVFGPKHSATEAETEVPVIEAPRKLAYIDLQPFFIQVKTSTGELQNVVVTLALEVEKGSDDHIRVERAMPRLYEAYLRTLTDRPLPGAADGQVEVAHIKNRIRAENLRMFGPGAVYDVVLRNIFITES